jgi:hypothetical protein
VNVVFTVATVSVVWFTSTSWRRDKVFAPYKVCGSEVVDRLRRQNHGGVPLSPGFQRFLHVPTSNTGKHRAAARMEDG